MSDAELKLSRDELLVCSGACLTYVGVPFHRTEPMRSSPADIDQGEHLFQMFIDATDELRNRKTTQPKALRTSRMTLSEDDLMLLIEVITAVLRENEPPSDHSDRNLEIHVGPRQEIEKTLKKLQTAQKRLQPA